MEHHLKNAVLLVSHGSRSPKTKKEITRLVKVLQKQSRIPIVEYAFLEIEKPSIPDGIARCIKKGAEKIIVTLNFLNSGRHVDIDIPGILFQAKRKYPKIFFFISKPVGQHPRIQELFIDMIHEPT